MPYPLSKDFISQTELRKGAEFMIGTSSAVRLLRELYLDALERRIARGTIIESGPLGFAQNVGVVPYSRPGLVSRSVRRAPPASSLRLAPIRSRLAAMSAALQ